MSEHLTTLINDSLQVAKTYGATAADACLTADTGFAASARCGDVESIEYHHQQHYAITFYQGNRSASVSTTVLTHAAIDAIIQKAAELVKYADEDPFSGLPDYDRLAFTYPDLDLAHDWSIDPHAAAQLAIECETLCRDYDARIQEAEGASVSTYTGHRFYANSLGFSGHYASSRHSITAHVVAKDQADMQREYDFTVARSANALEDVSVLAKRASQRAIQRLGSRQIATQHCPVIFVPSEAKRLLSTFVSAISGGQIYRKNSFLCDHLDQRIFPEHITIQQAPHLLRAMGSCPFDQEGVATQQQVFVKDGVLTRYVLGSYSARRLNMQTTGNAGGVFNLSISHSDQSLRDLCRAMGTGLLVTELIGQGVKLISGDYSKGASGFWVEHGEIQFPVSEITIAGNLRDMFSGIVAVGNDIDCRSSIRTGSIWINSMTVAGK